MKNIPEEIYRLIYSYVNPISKPTKIKRNIVWCKKCGEILRDGDWYINVSNVDYFMSYTCKNCNNDNIYEFDESFNDIDILIEQETGSKCSDRN